MSEEFFYVSTRLVPRWQYWKSGKLVLIKYRVQRIIYRILICFDTQKLSFSIRYTPLQRHFFPVQQMNGFIQTQRKKKEKEKKNMYERE